MGTISEGKGRDTKEESRKRKEVRSNKREEKEVGRK